MKGPGEGGAEWGVGGGGGGGCAWGDGLRWRVLGEVWTVDLTKSPVQSVALFTSECNYWAAQPSFGASGESTRLWQKLVSYTHCLYGCWFFELPSSLQSSSYYYCGRINERPGQSAVPSVEDPVVSEMKVLSTKDLELSKVFSVN